MREKKGEKKSVFSKNKISAKDKVSANDTQQHRAHNYWPPLYRSFVGTRANKNGHREPEPAGLGDLAGYGQYSARKYLASEL